MKSNRQIVLGVLLKAKTRASTALKRCPHCGEALFPSEGRARMKDLLELLKNDVVNNRRRMKMNNEDFYTEDLAEPGTNGRGQPYNDLPTGNTETSPLMNLGEGGDFPEPEERSPVETLPSWTDPAEEYQRKFGGQK